MRTKLVLRFDRWLLVESSRCNVAGKHHTLLLNISDLILGLFTLSSAAFAGFYFIFMGRRHVSVCSCTLTSLTVWNQSETSSDGDWRSKTFQCWSLEGVYQICSPGLSTVVRIGITAVYSLFAGAESHQPLSVAHPSRTTVSVISFVGS